MRFVKLLGTCNLCILRFQCVGSPQLPKFSDRKGVSFAFNCDDECSIFFIGDSVGVGQWAEYAVLPLEESGVRVSSPSPRISCPLSPMVSIDQLSMGKGLILETQLSKSKWKSQEDTEMWQVKSVVHKFAVRSVCFWSVLQLCS